MQASIVTHFVYPPIPIRSWDWQATLLDADEDGPVGHGATEAEAIADLQAQIEDAED